MPPLVVFVVSALVSPAGVGPAHGSQASPRVAVAWTRAADGEGLVHALEAQAPWSPVTGTLAVGADPIARAFESRLYVLSRGTGVMTVIDVPAWAVLETHPLGAASLPVDIAVVSTNRAYVARASTTHLLRIDPETGAGSDVLDLSGFADPDGNPDMGTMAISDGRLFIQLRRIEDGGPPTIPLLAVMDLSTETLVDVDPGQPGTQAIALRGTYPRGKMQVDAGARRLVVSATGSYHDNGGIELIDLDTFVSLGFAVDETAPDIGADTGAFVMTTSAYGYFSFSTDLLLSSHLHTFRLPPDGDFGPELHTTVSYIVPRILHDPASGYIFWPEGGSADTGVLVFDAATGAKLTAQPIPTTGTVTDLELLCPSGACADTPVRTKTWGGVKRLFEENRK